MRKDATKELRSQNIDAQRARTERTVQRNLKINKEAQDSVKQLQQTGLINDKLDVNEVVASLKGVEPLYNVDKGEERIDNQILAIMLMEGMQREFNGEYKPNFTLAGKLVGRSRSYMSLLWKDRMEILSQRDNLLESGLKMVQVKLVINLLKMTHALDSVENWERFFEQAGQFKNFIELFDKLILRARLLGNLSTDNVAHEHSVQHGGKVQLVPTDEITGE